MVDIAIFNQRLSGLKEVLQRHLYTCMRTRVRVCARVLLE